MNKVHEAELVSSLSMLFSPLLVIGTLVFLCIFVSNRYFKRKGRK